MSELRDPRDVPDAPSPEVWAGPFDPSVDTDGDGVADTAVTDDGVDLLLTTDLDGDGLADQIVRIGPDGVPRRVLPSHRGLLGALFDALDDAADPH